MSTSSAIVLASDRLSQALAISKEHMILTIKAQCFKGTHPDRVSDTQLAAYIQVSQALMAEAPKFNPLLPGFLYAYPDKGGGITPIIGPDGIFALLASNPEIEGWSTKFETFDGDVASVATIKHKRLGEISKTCFLKEWKVSSNPNWESRPKHMLEIRALKHAARQCIHGIPLDADEYALAKLNKGFEHALPVMEEGAAGDPAGAAPEAAARPPRPARRTGVAGTEKKVEAAPADTPQAAPKGEEAAPAAAAPAVDAEQHAAEAEADANAAFAETEVVDDPPAAAAEPAPKVVVADIKYPATLPGLLKLVKKGLNSKGDIIAVADFSPENGDGTITVYSEFAKVAPPETAKRFVLTLEQRPQKAPKPPVIFITKLES